MNFWLNIILDLPGATHQGIFNVIDSTAAP
jgi:hypothetical protein